jgi:uncharacterized LabA/DUF88 family protein
MKNQAFIDGQNLYLGTTNAKTPWLVDLYRFRVYLREKYKVEKAYYFIGAVDDDRDKLYRTIQEAGFILMFREHNSTMKGKKKGNVDTDIVFTVMEKIAEKEAFDKIILVSGDGDYIKMVKYLIGKDRLEKVIAPNQKSISSLYKSTIDNRFYTFLDDENTKRKVEIKG